MTVLGDEVIDDLWVRFLAHGAAGLDDNEDSRLAAFVERDPAALERLLDDDGVDGLLRAIGDGGDGFAARFIERLALEEAAAPFVRLVDRRIAEDEMARAPRARVRRIAPWVGVAALAAALAAVLAVVSWRGRQETRIASVPRPPRALPTTMAPPAVGAPAALLASADRVQPAARPPLALLAPVDRALPLPVGEALLSLDFQGDRSWERASASRRIEGRSVVGPGQRAALAAVGYNPGQNSFGVRIYDTGGLFRYDADLLVAFDYWIGEWTDPEPPQIVVGVGVLSGLPHEEEFEMAAPSPVAVRWTTVVARLGDLQEKFRRDPSGRLTDFGAPSRPPARLAPGDPITLLKVRVEGVRQDVLFIDRVRVIRPLVPRR